MLAGVDREFVTRQAATIRVGVDRGVNAFEPVASRPEKHLRSVTKPNAMSITMPFWDERVEAAALQFPSRDTYHLDIPVISPFCGTFCFASRLVLRSTSRIREQSESLCLSY
jgi:hypothetical protein